LAFYHCLSGSEQSTAISFNVFQLLSCLYGSEHDGRFGNGGW